MIDLDMIRARTAYDFEEIEGDVEKIAQLMDDRDDLLAYVDALRKAAGRVTCDTCSGVGTVPVPLCEDASLESGVEFGEIDCPDCADLRALISPAPSTAPDSTPATP